MLLDTYLSRVMLAKGLSVCAKLPKYTHIMPKLWYCVKSTYLFVLQGFAIQFSGLIKP